MFADMTTGIINMHVTNTGLVQTATGLSETFYAVLQFYFQTAATQRVTATKEPAQCCRHILSNTTMHSLK